MQSNHVAPWSEIGKVRPNKIEAVTTINPQQIDPTTPNLVQVTAIAGDNRHVISTDLVHVLHNHSYAIHRHFVWMPGEIIDGNHRGVRLCKSQYCCHTA